MAASSDQPLLVETCLDRVSERECDHLGHMNVQFYVARVSDAAWHVMAATE
jgi:acyl-CoA thioesterase FadM